MIKYIIDARKWRDTANGNTYHSVQIVNTTTGVMISSPFDYGYGKQFLESARARMVKQGWIAENTALDLRQIHAIDERENCTKKEVISHGAGEKMTGNQPTKGQKLPWDITNVTRLKNIR